MQRYKQCREVGRHTFPQRHNVFLNEWPAERVEDVCNRCGATRTVDPVKRTVTYAYPEGYALVDLEDDNPSHNVRLA